MNKICRFFAFFLSLCLLCGSGTVCAASGGYDYTITFYPGNRGTFTGTEEVSVEGNADASVSLEDGAIKVRGLKEGDIVRFDATLEGVVDLGEGSRYYVMGIRLSGRDNSTVDQPAFPVEKDRDYVVAYGVQGDEMVGYVVNYQDSEGNTLAPSRTYYGNVGDKPVAAYLYLEGYEPRAYNLTKTLAENEAENVFTFVYTQIVTESGSAAASTVISGGAGSMTETGAGVPAAGEEAGAATEEMEGLPAGGGVEIITGENVEPAAGGQGGEEAETMELEEEEVPLDVIDLDDEEVPLAKENPIERAAENGKTGFMTSAVIAIVSVMALMIFMIWLWMRRKKEENK